MRISTERINWRLALGELVLIVAGILIALGIDSYSERRSDATEANAYLQDLIVELRSDSVDLEARYAEVDRMISSARAVLRAVQGGEASGNDLGALLLRSLFGEGITPDPVVWEELRSTGGLRLLKDPEIRSAIVSHYLHRASRFRTIDENFAPAVRALRALAWDIMPVESFPVFMETRRTAVPNEMVLSGLRGRDDAEFLLKRLILTGSVARVSLRRVAARTTGLLSQLQE